MDADGPQLRRRGMFFNVETLGLDDTEHDSAEGISIRQAPRRRAAPAAQAPSLSHTAIVTHSETPQVSRRIVRSASGTGSRQQAQMSR